MKICSSEDATVSIGNAQVDLPKGLCIIGIGPSSSHTVGPMVAARQFASGLQKLFMLDDLVMHRQESLPFHANGMRFTAFDAAGDVLEVPVNIVEC